MTTTYVERILNPWLEFDRMNRMFNKAARRGTCEFPAVNVWINGGNAEISSEVPGVDREKLEISVSGNTVKLRGTRPVYGKKEDETRHRHEIRHGDFSKSVQLPFNIDADKVHASYKNGVLHVSLPQLEAEQPKKIEIKSE
jgi:HSP20 family protein